ncbi:unnamed protein product [Ilex paraguariensis]|uniref:Avr9/Cf-9 rapidly elicited protein 146 n=1 Tax=Ilex paraguariensis TaxID=185542 RepID=A0ABC8TYH2_9AQUA
MEPNIPVLAKKFWSIVRVAFFMLRKGISKRKLMLDLNLMMKRGKIAGKALQNLMFHHAHNWSSASSSATFNRHSHDGHLSFSPAGGEYEFSCSNSPAYPNFQFLFNLNKRKPHHSNLFPCAHAPPTDDDLVTVNAVVKALEMLNSEAASPALPGFGRSPMVRQLRVTDSPFPLREVEEDNHVDEAAEKFIMKFYSDLRRQNAAATSRRR